MKVEYKIKENNKPTVHISRDENATLFCRQSGNKFSYNKSNLYIFESKINNPRKENDRKFILSIRLDNSKDRTYKMSQMNFNEEELIVLRNNINKILEDK